MWLFTQGESWSELFSVASLTCFHHQEIKVQLFSAVGMEGGVNFRNRYHLSLEHQGNKTPSPTSPHAQEGWGNLDP